MGALTLLLGVVVVMMAVVGIGSAVVWLVQRANRIDGPGSDHARLAEGDDLRLQVEALQTEVDRLRDRVDFTERLLEKPREE